MVRVLCTCSSSPTAKSTRPVVMMIVMNIKIMIVMIVIVMGVIVMMMMMIVVDDDRDAGDDDNNNENNIGPHYTFIECLEHYYRVLVDTELALHLIGGGVCIHIGLIIGGDEVEGLEVR